MNKIIAILISAFLAGQTWAATVINVYPTNITTTSAYLQATITTNGGGSTGTVFYGFSDQTTNASLWSWSNDYGNITTTGTVSKQITGLQQAQKYYYRWRIAETGTYVWSAGTSNFWTKAASPTSTPTPVSISVQADPTTAALMAPTNFFNANTGLLDTALSGLFATDADVAAEASRAGLVEQQLGLAVTNLIAATNSLDTRAGALETSTQTLNTAVATLNMATGSMNSAIGDLNAATGALDTAVSNLQTSTGALNTAVSDLTAATGTLNSAVGDLQTSTGALNTAVGALQTSTGTLNTAVGALQTSTGTLNTAVADLQTSTGTLNTAVVNLNTATGSLNTAVGTLNIATGSLDSAVSALNTSTGSLNTAVSALNTSTGSLNTAVGALNVSTNALDTRVAALEGGGDAAGWSGFAATQEVFSTYMTTEVVTNIRVTAVGTLLPDVRGDYLYAGQLRETNFWYSTNGYYVFAEASSYLFGFSPAIFTNYVDPFIGTEAAFYIAAGGSTFIGDYTPMAGYATGTPTTAYFLTTNTVTWRSGGDPADPHKWHISKDGTNIYRGYGESNVFDKAIYGDGANLTGVNATNAVTLAGLPASDYAKQADYAATSNDVDAVEALAAGLNSVSSLVNRVVTADYPATSNLVDSVKAVADGLNSESNNWHVAATSIFHGAGSTGRVTSEAGDATKFLRGDGVFADPPAADYGTTDSTAARGDWFAAVSGRVDNLITSTQTLNTATNSLQSQININMPVGVILAYGASNAPTGWLLCNGAAVSRSTYAALFGVIGTTYGAGDESTTFNVPDMRQRFSLGGTNGLGASGGYAHVTLTTDQMPSHRHLHGDMWNGNKTETGSGGLAAGTAVNWGGGVYYTAYAGGNQSHSNMPPYLVVNYIIKY